MAVQWPKHCIEMPVLRNADLKREASLAVAKAYIKHELSTEFPVIKVNVKERKTGL